ncbi:hypothetical protein GCM10012275_54440 [Longimycelium tulufanense]|uniref:Phage tail tape measure protein domain-containing protein n=1 Tax=Longimycelium tulufanense TaxID=907463 RepID=A0A8J3FWG5_9PSEU|nr:phage tail tape measure protein [Longimycelium tulufanense]GGM76881.1 hypothetical protein GCM10012275_54440 [Longimycelium tulufanense]
MALTIGELVGYLDLESKGFDTGVETAKTRFAAFGTWLGRTAVTVGAGAALALGTSLAGAVSAEAAHDKLAAQLGLTEAESARIGATAGQLYSQAYGESLEQINDAIRGVIHHIDGMRAASEADLQRITAKALDLSTVMAEDVGKVTRAVGKLLKTGLVADADEAFDVIIRGFQTGADEAQDLLDTVSEYSTKFRDLGLTGQEAMGLLSQGLQAGARDADTVADALKEFAIRAIDGSKTTVEGFDAIGLSAEEMAATFARGGPQAAAALDVVLDRLRGMEDPVARDAAAVALFGTKAEDLGDALFALDPSAAVTALGDVAGAADRMGTTLNDNAATRLEAFKRQVSAAFVEFLGGQAIPALEAVVGVLSRAFGPALAVLGEVLNATVIPALQAMAQWLSENQVPVSILAGLIATVLVPHLIVLGVAATVSMARVAAAWLLARAQAIAAAVVHSVQIALMVAQFAWLGVQALIHAARVAAAWVIAMGPVGWVMAAVVALVALIIANWDTIKEQTAKIWTAVWDKVSAVWTVITSWVSANVRRVLDAIGWLRSIPDRVRAFFERARAAAIGKLVELVSWVAGLPGRILRALGNLRSLLYNAGRDLIQGMIRGVSHMVGRLLGKVRQMAQDAVNTVKSWLGIGSPSRVFAQLGEFTGEGFAIGLERMAPMVSRAATLLANRASAVDLVLPSPASAVTGAAVHPAVAPLLRPGAQAGTERSAVHIEHFHATPAQSPHAIASELDWLSRTGG